MAEQGVERVYAQLVVLHAGQGWVELQPVQGFSLLGLVLRYQLVIFDDGKIIID